MLGYTVKLAAFFNLVYGLLKNIDNMAHLGWILLLVWPLDIASLRRLSQTETSFTPQPVWLLKLLCLLCPARAQYLNP